MELPLNQTVVIGAGPGGLSAAYELVKLGRAAFILEQDDTVGGISRTCEYNGYRFDIGGHRFFTKVEYVAELWREILGSELLTRPRLSRIYYRGKFFDYPLKPLNALVGLGPIESIKIGLSYLRAQLFPSREEDSFEQWVSNRFGRRLYEIFFKTYTEKVWGMACAEISADWAAQRIKNLDLTRALLNALVPARQRSQVITTLIEEFHYPRLGPGQMWERCADLLDARGIKTVLGARVVRVHHSGGRIDHVVVRENDGPEYDVRGTEFVSSMPLRTLVRMLDPKPPKEVLAAADQLRYRDFLTVALIIDREELFPDNWIYIHSNEVRVGRIQNFKNWSPDMVPDRGHTALGFEYFAQEDDELWSMSDEALLSLARTEGVQLGLVPDDISIDGCVVRMPKAYPVYDSQYQEALAVIREYLGSLSNLQQIGRNGQHRYNNQDHSMLTGVYAARNVDGASYDIWSVNVEEDYLEEQRDGRRSGDRLVPEAVPAPSFESTAAQIYARYDPVALGVAIGAVLAIGLFLATITLLLQGGDPPGPMLSLLGNYLVGYTVTWSGAFWGLLEAGLCGFLFGWMLGRMINALISHERSRLILEMDLLGLVSPSQREVS